MRGSGSCCEKYVGRLISRNLTLITRVDEASRLSKISRSASTITRVSAEGTNEITTTYSPCPTFPTPSTSHSCQSPPQMNDSLCEQRCKPNPQTEAMTRTYQVGWQAKPASLHLA